VYTKVFHDKSFDFSMAGEPSSLLLLLLGGVEVWQASLRDLKVKQK